MGFDGSTIKKRKKQATADANDKIIQGNTENHTFTTSFFPSISEFFSSNLLIPLRLVIGAVVIFILLTPTLVSYFQIMDDGIKEANYEAAINERTISVNTSMEATEIEDIHLLNCAKSIMQHSDVNTPEELSILVCMDSGISSLKGISSLSGLTMLNLNSNNVEDIFEISHLKKLQTLSLIDNPIKNISILEEIETLADVLLPNLPDVYCYEIYKAVRGMKSNVKNIECRGKWTPAIQVISDLRIRGIPLTEEQQTIWDDYEFNKAFMPSN